MIVFHLTPPENLPLIAKEGLTPRIGENSSLIGETTPAVFAFASAEDLLQGLESPWVDQAFPDYDPLPCLMVDVSDLKTSSVVPFEVMVLEVIPPDRIRVASFDMWDEVDMPDLSGAKLLRDALQEKDGATPEA